MTAKYWTETVRHEMTMVFD